MDRILAISLSFSVAAHLAVGGLASLSEQTSAPSSNTLSITLNPVTVASSKPTPAQPAPKANTPEDTAKVTETNTVLTVAEKRPTQSASEQQDRPVQRQAITAPPTQPEQLALQTNTTPPGQQAETRQTNDNETRQQIQQGLHRLFNTHFYYPRMAQQRGMEGTVHIGLHITASGEITDIHLARGSGTDILDNAALQSAQKITVYPESTQLLEGKALDLVMPVKFQLTNG